MSRYWLLSFSLLCASASYADESVQPEQNIDVPDPLKTEVEFGYQAHTGNTDSRSLNARLSAEYTSGRHRSMVNGSTTTCTKTVKKTNAHPPTPYRVTTS